MENLRMQVPEFSQKSEGSSSQLHDSQQTLKLEIPLQSADESWENIFIEIIEYKKNGLFMIKEVRDYAV
jgi:hypothetical protein